MNALRFSTLALLFLFAILGHAPKPALAQNSSTPTPTPTPTLGLDLGRLEFSTPSFKLKLVKASQTIAALEPVGAAGFDFTPADRIERRAADNYHHLGDIILRVKQQGANKWQDYSSAGQRRPVTALAVGGQTLAAADLTPTFPAEMPLRITRSWLVQDGQLLLKFELTNTGIKPVEIGGLGLPVVFNNIITGRNLEQAHEICSFADPYIGLDGGYLQVTRLSGRGPALIVVPDKNTQFEAYQILNEPARPNQTFEGTFAWMVHTKAFAENEWKDAKQWNTPTAVVLPAGASRTYGLKFLLANEIRHIDSTLEKNRRPVVVGIPGYVLPGDIDGQVFLKTELAVTATEVDPIGSLTIRPLKSTQGGWKRYSVKGNNWGRARLVFTYANGSKQSISYYVTKPASQAVADLGNFLMNKQWFVDPNDPFHRSPSVMSYDRETEKIVTQDSRVWIAGLGDEGGSGSWLAAAMKQFGQPDRNEIAKYEQFVDHVLWGGIQYKDGPNKYGVRKSLFYYSPTDLPNFQYDPKLNWTTWTSWKKSDAESIGRGYNYPHVIAAYWSMYRLARNHSGLVKNHEWSWYLDQAYETAKFMFGRKNDGKRQVGYVELGLMEGDIVLAVLEDLKREDWKDKATVVEELMRERAEHWRQEAYPFGSEMAWDSTGQEEVYAWCKYFGFTDKALVSLNSIIGYMPTIPHWGYNGNARRYWDFLYGGKLRRIERQLHHYGSGLNAIPVLSHYRDNPDDFYLLRVGYGGTMGALTNIDQQGFASVAFHSFPSTLKWDPYSGDYGPNFYGHAFNTATYVIDHPEFGWQAFGGNIKQAGPWVKVQPLDSFRMRFYVAPRGLWLTLDAGTFEAVEINVRTHEVRVALGAATEFTPRARLRVEQPAHLKGVGSYKPRRKLELERGAYVVPLKKQRVWVDLSDQ